MTEPPDDGLRIGGWLPRPAATPPTESQPAPTPPRDAPAPSDQPTPSAPPDASSGTRTAAPFPRWTARPVLVPAAVAAGVLVAAVLTLVLVPSSAHRSAGDPPPPAAPAPNPPPFTLPTPGATSPSTPAREPSGAYTVSRRPTRPAPPSRPEAPAGPPALAPLPPSRESGLRSVESERDTAIEFVNARAETVIVYWLDFAGRRVRYAILGAGASYRQQTYVTHPWVVTDVRQTALVVFLPAAEPARATIR